MSFTSDYTPQVLETVLKRSEEGSGIKAAFTELGLDAEKGLDWLKQYHHGRVVAAKKIQIERAEAKAKEAKP